MRISGVYVEGANGMCEMDVAACDNMWSGLARDDMAAGVSTYLRVHVLLQLLLVTPAMLSPVKKTPRGRGRGVWRAAEVAVAVRASGTECRGQVGMDGDGRR